MSLTKEYIDEVMDNLAFFKNSKRPCQINLASGQELIHNISQINKKARSTSNDESWRSPRLLHNLSR